MAAKGECAGWATAALANHPPRGVEPNVQAIQVDWEGCRPHALAGNGESVQSIARKLVNPMTRATWYIDGATGVSVGVPCTLPTRGLVFLASCQIEPGEEVYFNYRLDPGNRPDWYADVPEELAWKCVDDAAKQAAAEKEG